MSENKLPKKRNALGRGLGALLEDSASHLNDRSTERSSANFMDEIPLKSIEVNPFQPRTFFDKGALEELAESIRIQGIIQPITVRKLNKDSYQLIAGERRYQASKMAGLENIPAYVRTANDQQMLEMALIENIQRENLNALEIALSYQRLLTECSLKQEELGDRVGKNRTTINNYLRLLKLPPDIQIGLRDNKITMGHARAIINIENADLQLEVYKKIIDEDLSVRKVEALVRNLVTEQPKDNSPAKVPNLDKEFEVKHLQNKLSSHFGSKIQVRRDENNRGEIKIPFVSDEDLNRILEILAI
ncbi:MAG: ParB/RepB/Spo0J family partition protein [Bacteroidota bacterium]|nr:ParB/RepB/Spo0J family partition protein [Bacteroidota bacterium]